MSLDQEPKSHFFSIRDLWRNRVVIIRVGDGSAESTSLIQGRVEDVIMPTEENPHPAIIIKGRKGEVLFDPGTTDVTLLD